MKFAIMDRMIWEMDLKIINNTISLGHMANKINVFTWTSNTTAFNPPAAMSLGNPYGQMSFLWFLWISDTSQVGDSSISIIGRQLTIAWNES